MSILNRLKVLGALGIFLISSGAFAQSSVSTYTALGLGEFNKSGLTQNQAMGGLGISFGTGWGVNYVNPALSTRNTIFNFQGALNYKRVALNTADQSDLIDGGGLSYAMVSLPVKSGKRTLSLGMNQVSTVNYSLLVNGTVTNSDLTSLTRIDGQGGISEAFLAYGFTPVKNLSFGVTGSYLFGSTLRTNQLTLLNADETPIGVSSELYQRFTVSDVTLKGGTHYFFKVGPKSQLHLGAIYQAFGNINGKEFVKVADFGQASRPDGEGDVIVDNVKGSVFIPQNIGFGLSYERINKFVIGLEGQYQELSRYRTFTGGDGGLRDSFKIGLGGQFTPDFAAVDNLLKRSTFRAGIEYQETPYILNNTKVNDLGINFGGSVPVNSLSLLNFAVKLGTRGTTANGLIRENYVSFTLGFSLNDNSWFFKRVYE